MKVFFLGIGAIFLIAHGGHGVDSNLPQGALHKRIADAISNLGSEDFATRERAARELWEIGDPALEALGQTIDNTGDPEVVNRAKGLASKMRLGIGPDTPRALWHRFEHFESGTKWEQLGTVRELLKAGAEESAKRLIATIPHGEQRAALAKELVGGNPLTIFRYRLAHDDEQVGAALLEYGALNGLGVDHYAAYLMLTGQLDGKLEELSAATGGDQSWLYRLLLLKLGRPEAEAFIGESEFSEEDRNDWYAMRGRWRDVALSKGRRGWSSVQAWGSFATAARWGNEGDLYRQAATGLEAWLCESGKNLALSTSLLIADIDDHIGLAIRRNQTRHAFELRVDQGRLRDALQLLGIENPNHIDPWIATLGDYLEFHDRYRPSLLVRAAVTLHQAGNTSGARKMVRALCTHLDPVTDPAYWQACGEAAAMGYDDIVRSQMVVSFEPPPEALWSLVRPLVSKRRAGLSQDYLWRQLRLSGSGESPCERLLRLRDLLAGSLDQDEAEAILLSASDALREDPKDAARHTTSLERIALKYPPIDLTAAMARDPLGAEEGGLSDMELGRRCLKRSEFDKARVHFRKAADAFRATVTNKNFPSELPLAIYLQGEATTRTGDAEAGEQLRRRALLFCLGSLSTHYGLACDLEDYGIYRAPDASAELAVDLAPGGEGVYACNLAGYATWGERATRSLDYRLRCMETNLYRMNSAHGFIFNHAPLLKLTSQLHLTRAELALQRGDFAGAAAEAERCLVAIPRLTDHAMTVTAALDAAGEHELADALFDKQWEFHTQRCRDFPDSAAFYNSAAWVAAVSRRELEAGFVHAERAVAFEPENSAYWDTLAELHFASGDRAKAIEASERAVSIDATSPTLRRQLERFRTGPSPQRPPQR